MKGYKEATPEPLKDNGREPIKAARKIKGGSERNRPNSPKRTRRLAMRSRLEARREQNK